MTTTAEWIGTPNGAVLSEKMHFEAEKGEGKTKLAPPTTNGVAAAREPLAFDSIEDTIVAFRKGSFIIVLDAPTRENEGDLICAAEDFTPEKASFMIRHTSGLICCPVSATVASTLQLPQMVPAGENGGIDGTAYTVSVDAVGYDVTTGISAQDRATTCQRLSSMGAQPGDFTRPGHVFPLRAREGGVRVRRGHTEATIEFCKLAGKREVGAICELVEDGEVVDDGEEEGFARKTERTTPHGGMLRGEGCLAFGRRWGIRVCTIESLVEYLEK